MPHAEYTVIIDRPGIRHGWEDTLEQGVDQRLYGGHAGLHPVRTIEEAGGPSHSEKLVIPP